MVNPTILIVEDHDAVRMSLRRWLSTAFPDCDFLEARSGEEAVRLARTHPPDIVLMDISLPEMNGIKATRQLKTAVPPVRVVMLTIHEAAEYQADAAAAGASAYVRKHTMYTELVPVLAGLLSQPADTLDGSPDRDEG